MKCDICKKKIENNFLNKVVGTYLKDSKGKKRVVCNECQKKYGSEKKIREELL